MIVIVSASGGGSDAGPSGPVARTMLRNPKLRPFSAACSGASRSPTRNVGNANDGTKPTPSQVGIGVGIAIVIELFRIPSLPFAVGVYLPVGTTFTVFLGGLLRYFMERNAPDEEEKSMRREKGILFGSGLVGGEGLLGVVIAGAVFILGHTPEGFGTAWAGSFAWIIAVVALAGLGFVFMRRCVRK